MRRDRCKGVGGGSGWEATGKGKVDSLFRLTRKRNAAAPFAIQLAAQLAVRTSQKMFCSPQEDVWARSDSTRFAVQKLYSGLAWELSAQPRKRAFDTAQERMENIKLLTRRKQFVHAAYGVFLPDDDEVEDVFKAEQDIHILDVDMGDLGTGASAFARCAQIKRSPKAELCAELPPKCSPAAARTTLPGRIFVVKPLIRGTPKRRSVQPQ